MTKIILAMTLLFSVAAFAQTSQDEAAEEAAGIKKDEAKALSAVEHNPEIIKAVTEAKNNGCTELPSVTVQIGSVGYGFSAEDQVLVIKRMHCSVHMAHSSISTITSLVTLKSDDMNKHGAKVLVNAVDLNNLVFQNQAYKPKN